MAHSARLNSVATWARERRFHPAESRDSGVFTLSPGIPVAPLPLPLRRALRVVDGRPESPVKSSHCVVNKQHASLALCQQHGSLAMGSVDRRAPISHLCDSARFPHSVKCDGLNVARSETLLPPVSSWGCVSVKIQKRWSQAFRIERQFRRNALSKR